MVNMEIYSMDVLIIIVMLSDHCHVFFLTSGAIITFRNCLHTTKTNGIM